MARPHVTSGVVRIERGWDVASVETKDGRVASVTFQPSFFSGGDPDKRLTIRARLTIDSSDLGDVIRRSGAGYLRAPTCARASGSRVRRRRSANSATRK